MVVDGFSFFPPFIFIVTQYVCRPSPPHIPPVPTPTVIRPGLLWRRRQTRPSATRFHLSSGFPPHAVLPGPAKPHQQLGARPWLPHQARLATHEVKWVHPLLLLRKWCCGFSARGERAQGEGVGGEERRCWHFFENVLPLRKPGSWSSMLETWIPISDTRRTPGPLPCLRLEKKLWGTEAIRNRNLEIKWFWLELHGTCGVQDRLGCFLRVFCIQPMVVLPYKPNPTIGVCFLQKALIISLKPADLAFVLRQQLVNSGKWLTCPTLLPSIDQALGRTPELTVHLWFNLKHIPKCWETSRSHPPLCLGEGPRQSPGEGLATAPSLWEWRQRDLWWLDNKSGKNDTGFDGPWLFLNSLIHLMTGLCNKSHSCYITMSLCSCQ